MPVTTPWLAEPRRGTTLLRPQPDLVGRAADAVARVMGTGRFLVGQSAALVVRLIVDAPGSPLRFDHVGCPLLTVLLSLEAATAAPPILLEQNRQDDRDREVVADLMRPEPSRHGAAAGTTVDPSVACQGFRSV